MEEGTSRDNLGGSETSPASLNIFTRHMAAKAWRLLLAGASLLWLLPWASAIHRSDFPASFLFGTATSSYQVSLAAISLFSRRLDPSDTWPVSVSDCSCHCWSNVQWRTWILFSINHADMTFFGSRSKARTSRETKA